jgi:hypothetical protein
MSLGKKTLAGLAIIIFLNYGFSLVMKFFAVKTSTYSDYITWLSFLIIMWIFLQKENDFTFDDTSKN